MDNNKIYWRLAAIVYVGVGVGGGGGVECNCRFRQSNKLFGMGARQVPDIKGPTQIPENTCFRNLFSLFLV